MTVRSKTCYLCGQRLGQNEVYVYSRFTQRYYHPPDDIKCKQRREKEKKLADKENR